MFSTIGKLRLSVSICLLLICLQPLAVQAQLPTPEFKFGAEGASISVDVAISPGCDACAKLFKRIINNPNLQDLVNRKKILINLYPVLLDKKDLLSIALSRCSKQKSWGAFYNAVLRNKGWGRHTDDLGNEIVVEFDIAVRELRSIFVPNFVTDQEFTECGNDTELLKPLIEQNKLVWSKFSVSSVPILSIDGERAVGDGKALVLLYEKLKQRGYDFKGLIAPLNN